MKSSRGTRTARRGRPRDGTIDTAVLDAVDEALRALGPGGLTIAEVARRAGVGKPTIYRRWPDREHLVISALERRLGAVQEVDTGCTLCDLHEVIDLAGRTYGALGPDAVASLVVGAGTDRDLRADLIQTLLSPTRAAVRRVLDSAADRHDLRADLDGTELGLAADAVCSLVFHRLLLGEPPLSSSEIEAVVVGLLRGLAADAEVLLAQYDDPSVAHTAPISGTVHSAGPRLS